MAEILTLIGVVAVFAVVAYLGKLIGDIHARRRPESIADAQSTSERGLHGR